MVGTAGRADGTTTIEAHDLLFDVQIGRSGTHYRVETQSMVAGEASADFERPVSDLEFGRLLTSIAPARRGSGEVEESRPSVDLARIRDFGARLYRAAFPDDVGYALRRSLDEAERLGVGVCIRLRLRDVPELQDLPWEYLYDPGRRTFLALSRRTPIVRYAPLARPIRALTVEPPLEALVVIASPNTFATLDSGLEWRRLNEAVRRLTSQELLHLDLLEHATPWSLEDRLQRGRYNLVHFIGHGGFDAGGQEGQLVLEDETGGPAYVSADQVGRDLADEGTLRLVVLNSCEGARTSLVNSFAGTAQRLVELGIPAVIAMQFEITDEAATVFAQAFYGAIANFLPVDKAVSEARKAIEMRTHSIEWATPALYMRSSDGRIFERQSDVAEGAAAAPVVQAARLASAVDDHRTAEAIAAESVLTATAIEDHEVEESVIEEALPGDSSRVEAPRVETPLMPEPAASADDRESGPPVGAVMLAADRAQPAATGPEPSSRVGAALERSSVPTAPAAEDSATSSGTLEGSAPTGALAILPTSIEAPRPAGPIVPPVPAGAGGDGLARRRTATRGDRWHGGRAGVVAGVALIASLVLAGVFWSMSGGPAAHPTSTLGVPTGSFVTGSFVTGSFVTDSPTSSPTVSISPSPSEPTPSPSQPTVSPVITTPPTTAPTAKQVTAPPTAPQWDASKWLDFNETTVGDPKPADLPVGNVGTAPLHIYTVKLEGSGDFSISRPPCLARPIAVGTACTVQVTFAPTVLGAIRTTIKFDTQELGVQTVSLYGTGIEGAIRFYYPVLDFGLNTSLHRVASKVETIVADAPVRISDAKVVTASSVFAIVESPAGCEASSSQACTVIVAFDPPGAGTYSGEVAIVTAAGKSYSFTVTGQSEIIR